MRPAETLRGRRVIVTGAAGFLGSHQVCALRGVADLHTISRRPLPEDPTFTQHVADLAVRDATLALFASIRPDCVIHLAGFANGGQGVESLYPSVTGDLLTTIHVLEACLIVGCRRLVITGSLEEGDGTTPSPSPYAVSKHAASQYAELCHRLYDLPVVTARIFMTYGPGQPSHKLIPRMIANLSRGRPFDVHSGERAVDWIYIHDVTHALLKAAAVSGLEGKTFDIGSGVLTPVADLARTVARMMEREKLLGFAQPNRRDERVRAANLAETERHLDWRPQVTLDEGLRRTIEALAPKEAIR